MILHWRHKALLWDEDKKLWVFRLKANPKLHYCHTLFCNNASDLHKTQAGWVAKPHCPKCRKRLSRANNVLSSVYNDLKHSATRRNIPFDLTRGDFYLFCIENDLYGYQAEFSKHTLSVDRIRNDEGYHFNNIQVLTVSENIKKEHQRRFKSKWQHILDSQTPDDNDPF